MGRRTKRIAIVKPKEEKKPRLTMTPLEIRNARKSFLLREELRYEELKHNKWEEIKQLMNSDELPSEEKKVKENELFKIVVNCDEELIKLNEELLKIELIEKDERHQKALDEIIEIKDDSEEVEIIEIINLND